MAKPKIEAELTLDDKASKELERVKAGFKDLGGSFDKVKGGLVDIG